MVWLAEVLDWVETFGVARNYYIGKLDNKKDMSIGVYQRKNDGQPRIALGGLKNTSYEVKPISILVHWNMDAYDTEQAAYKLFERLQTVEDVTIGDTHIHFIELLNVEPIDVGTDDKGVYERVIQFNLIYER